MNRRDTSTTHAVEAETKWRDATAATVAEKLTDRGFPCIFARNAHRKGLVEMLFADDIHPATLDALAHGLANFADRCRDWDGRLDTAPPLVVFFHPRCTTATDVDDYHRFGWHVLTELHRRDPEPWPADVPTEPGHPMWSMCFAGMPLFVNMSTPAHHRRRSRNLGECFAFVINPLERFDVVAGDTPRGSKTRETIRRRVLDYDGVPASADLAVYGGEAVEWKQYEIKDDDAHPHGTCPFPPAAPGYTHGHAA